MMKNKNLMCFMYLSIVLLIVGLSPVSANASGETTLDISLGSITISATGANGAGVNESALNPAGYIIVMGSGTSTTNTITVTTSTSVTLSGINIDVSGTEKACAFSVESGGTVNLNLVNTNTIKSGKNKAGLQVPSGTAIVISGTGSLTVTGGAGSAGIGGGYNGNGGNITISGGKVTAEGGWHGAGIGGGDGYVYTCENGNSGTITINGSAEVTALGNGFGAGIGGGGYGNNEIVTIADDAKVTASSGGEGAGIGGGYQGSGGTITIEGNAEVEATAGYKGLDYSGGAGIGGGGYYSGGIINITDNSKVTATGGVGGAGIGGGSNGAGGTITIDGDATVMAKVGVKSGWSFLGGAGIGGGHEGAGGTIIIAGSVEVTAIGDDYAAGIGGGYSCSGGTTTISENAKVTATGGFTGAGIGGGYQADCGTITIEDNAVITAIGGEDGAGIGGSAESVGGTVNISGGTVTATGRGLGAGIGSGLEGVCDTVNINSGMVTATGGLMAAGIGGGQKSGAGTINIAGGTVNATAGNGAAGIGGGFLGSGGTISIVGGTVYAQKRGDFVPYDIGYGQGGANVTLSISGDSAVLLKNNLCVTPTTMTHSLYSTDIQTKGKVFGNIDVPPGWEDSTTYAYLNKNHVSTLVYDANGGTGTVPKVLTQYNGTKAVISIGSDLIKNRLGIKCWNTQSDGLGIDYASGDTYTFSEDTTFYAKYKDPVHVISVNLSGSKTMTNGHTLALNATVLPTDATYPEVTWSSSDNSIATVDSDGNVKALCRGKIVVTVTTQDGEFKDTCEITVKPRPFTVTFNYNGTSLGVVADEGSYIIGPDNPIKKGYTFEGWWYTDVDTIQHQWNLNSDKMPSNNLSLFAKWTANPYTISFDPNGGIGKMPPESFTYDRVQKLTANAFTNTGYIFSGWATSSTGDVKYRDGENVSNLIAENGSNVTLYAKWSLNTGTFIITFNSQGGSEVASIAVTKNNKLAVPDKPTKIGYTFVAWYMEAACKHTWNFSKDKVTSNITLYAKWNINKYTVTFNSEGGGKVSSNKINYNSTISQPKKPKKTGYTFAGWYKEEGLINAWDFATDKVAGDTMLYAKWDINIYNVKFNSKGGSAVSGITAEYDSLITAPVQPTITGYTFAGWYKETKCKHTWNFSSDKIKANTTLYAKWIINKYTVHFNSEGGSDVADKIASYDSEIKAPKAPVKTGYTFRGWYKDEAYANSWSFSNNKVTGDITLYAKWVSN